MDEEFRHFRQLLHREYYTGFLNALLKHSDNSNSFIQSVLIDWVMFDCQLFLVSIDNLSSEDLARRVIDYYYYKTDTSCYDKPDWL